MSSNRKHLILDMSSICWTSLLAGTDKEFGRDVVFNDKVVRVNSAEHGYEFAMNVIMGALRRFDAVPSNLVLVVEGKNSKSLRQSISANYKAGRDSRPPEAYEEFNKCKEALVAALTGVGAAAVTQDGLEADDVIAYLAQELDGEKYIISEDGDLAVLVSPPEEVGDHSGLSPHAARQYRRGSVHQWRRGELDVNPYGPFPHKYITLYKALVGDPGDGYGGAYKFGEKAFLDLYCLFGDEGLDAMIDLIEQRNLGALKEDVGELKALQKIIDGAEAVYTCWKLARLYTEKVNTMRKPLQWSPGMVKPRAECTDDRLKPYAQQVRLVHAGNYAEAVAWAKDKLPESPFIALDIETATPEESDEWMKKGKDTDSPAGVDVFGSELVGCGVTFGNNSQYTLYFTVEHEPTPTVQNCTSEQVRDFVALKPAGTPLVVQNASFELSILFKAWGDAWKDNGFHGFLPDVDDTKILASYVNENISSGLKQSSQHYLGYTQQTYDEVTTIEKKIYGLSIPEGWTAKVVGEDEGGDYAVCTKRYKMHELTAEHVLSYGADDTICTAALYNHYRRICAIENTWDVYREVEVYPAYLTALAFVQGVPISLQRMLELEHDDDKAYENAWTTVRAYLMEHGWEGTVCPKYTELTPAVIKEAVLLTTGEEFKTQVRTVSKFPPLLDDAGHHLIAQIVRNGDVDSLNDLVKSRFDGEPKLDIDSPKQMRSLLYGVMNIPIRWINPPTDTERAKAPDLVAAAQKFKKIQLGSESAGTLTPAEYELLRNKAKTDDTAIDSALVFDSEVVPVAVLEAIKVMKTVGTRRKLFYKPYRYVQHWIDGLVHAHVNQCAAATRRYSASAPNLQQLPKKGEGVKFREIFLPHHKDAVVGSIDFVGQELRLMAGQSLDPNMMACYVGDKKKDIHSITAAGAMKKKWGAQKVAELFEQNPQFTGLDAEYDLFVSLRKSADAATAKAADDLRKTGKNVNFAAQFDAQALKLSEMLLISLGDAQAFLDAKYAMFPRVETWKEDVRGFVERTGFATTMLGARRHLAHAVLSENKWEASKAGRQGPNFKIQGSAAEMTKLAMARLWKSGVLFKLDVRFYAPIHDELVFSVHRDHAIEFIRILHECMTQTYADLPVPILGSISIGRTFGEQIECGDEFDPAAIQKALDEIFEAAVV